jgi:hypothetical protein
VRGLARVAPRYRRHVCVANNVFRSLLEGIARAVLVVFQRTFTFVVSIRSVYWSLYYEIPLVTLIFTVVVLILKWLVIASFRRRMFRRQLELDRVYVRQKVYYM